MLRVNVRSFARRNAKELRIELVDLVQEAGALSNAFSSDPWLRIVISLHVPSIGRHIDDRVPAFDQQLPKRFRVVYPAGKAASDSYDSDAIFMHKWPVANGKQPILAAFIE